MFRSRSKPSAPIRLRCPACRRQNLFVTTTHTNDKGFEVEGGQITAGYDTGAMPEHIRTRAKCCDCDHEWRVKGETWKDQK